MNNLDLALYWLETQALAQFWAGFLCFVRIGAVMALMPTFGERVVPMRIRLTLTAAMTLIVSPAIGPSAEITLSALLAEAVIGLALGAGFRIFVAALQMAGTIAAQATSLAQVFGGAAADPQPAFSHLLTVGALALSFTIGLHVHAAELLIRSYTLLPQGQFPTAGVMAEWGIGQVSRSFSLAFVLAAPFIIGSVVYNAAMGAINRAMPTLMVAFIGAPALTLGGLILMFLTTPLILVIWARQWLAWLADPYSLTP